MGEKDYVVGEDRVLRFEKNVVRFVPHVRQAGIHVPGELSPLKAPARDRLIWAIIHDVAEHQHVHTNMRYAELL